MNTDCKPTLTAKLMNEKLKRNWGTAQFTEYLQMTEEDFKKILDDTFEGPAGESFRRRLKKNDKKIEQQLRRRAVSVKTLEEKSVEETESDNAADTADSTEENDDIAILEKLQREEEFYRNYLISLENDHKAAVSERKQLFENLGLFRTKMLELRKEIEECQRKAQSYTIQQDQISAKLEKINQDKAETKNQISEIQQRINQLQKIEIFVDNGQIEIVPADYEIPDGWKELRGDWLDDERFESLTLIELSILAKAVLLAKAISADGRKSTFVFDSALMQELFYELSK